MFVWIGGFQNPSRLAPVRGKKCLQFWYIGHERKFGKLNHVREFCHDNFAYI